MTVNRKKRRTASSLPGGLAVGLGAGVLVSVAMIALLAYLIVREKLPQDAIGWGAMAVLVFGSGVSAMVSAKRIRTRTAMVCLLGSAIYFVTMLGLTALLFGGEYDSVGISAAMILIGCAGAFLGCKLKISGGKTKKAYKAYL